MAVPTWITNRIRSVIDALPRALRDSRAFMYPFFWIWFKGKDVRTCMELKTLAPAMSASELRDVYRRVESFASGRKTDAHPEALDYVLSAIPSDAASLLDVGCGDGYFLAQLREDPRFQSIRLAGCDFSQTSGAASYVIGNIESLPFPSRAFDVVTCFHTLEHTRSLDDAIAELKRICGKLLIVVVPRQKYFYYTFDLHLQFFEEPEALCRAMAMDGTIRQFGSDLVYIAAT